MHFGGGGVSGACVRSLPEDLPSRVLLLAARALLEHTRCTRAGARHGACLRLPAMTSVLWHVCEARALMKRFSWGSCRASNHDSSREGMGMGVADSVPEGTKSNVFDNECKSRARFSQDPASQSGHGICETR